MREYGGMGGREISVAYLQPEVFLISAWRCDVFFWGLCVMEGSTMKVEY